MGADSVFVTFKGAVSDRISLLYLYALNETVETSVLTE